MKNAHSSAVSSDVQKIARDVETLLNDVGRAGGSTLDEFRNRIGHALDSARSRLNEIDTGVRSRARDAATYADDFAHERPWQLIGAAVLAGLAIGWLMSRR